MNDTRNSNALLLPVLASLFLLPAMAVVVYWLYASTAPPNPVVDTSPDLPADLPPAEPPAPAPPPAAKATPAAAGWRSLFDGRSLDGWTVPKLAGGGKVHVEDGSIVLGPGEPITMVTYSRGDFPRVGYEVAFEGKKVEGEDFFCAPTFPVGETHCSLILGGWGGTVVGLSNVNHENASQNMTTTSKEFARDRWYAIRLRVTTDRIAVWIDDEQVIDLDAADQVITIRRDCEASTPFGLMAYKTTGAVRNLRVRPLTEAEKKAVGGK